MCNHLIQHSAKDLGKTYKSKCTKEVYKDDLCSKHYIRQQKKLANWGNRENYRPITKTEMLRGCHMKLANSNIHALYRYRKGNIERYFSSNDNWIISILLPEDIHLFVIKN